MTPSFKERLKEILTDLHTIPCKINREEALSEILKLVKEAVPQVVSCDLSYKECVCGGYNVCRKQFLTNIGEDSDSQTK